MNSRFAFMAVVWIGLFSGCSLTPLSNPSQTETQVKVTQLTQMLCHLHGSVNADEAKDLAQTSILYAKKLGEKYHVVSPPLWHNTLVNVGLKERGLCYEWAEDMLRHLWEKQYTTLQLHAVGANIGSYFEHNALAVTAKDQTYQDGVVLDAWRKSGNLFFIPLQQDKKYQWKNRKRLYRSIVFKSRHAL